MDGGREPLGLPGPWQEPLELVGLGPARDYTLEHVGTHAKGSTPLSFAVATRLATIAQWRAPPSEPAKRAFFLPRAIGRMARSMTFVSSSIRPSSRNSTNPVQWRRA